MQVDQVDAVLTLVIFPALNGYFRVLSRNELNDLTNVSHMLYFSQDLPMRIVGFQGFLFRN